MKFVLSGVFLAMLLAVAGATARLVTVAATRPLTPPLGPGLIALQLAGCLAAAATAWSRVRSGAELKRVAFSESSLRVSNFRREIIVPVSDVDVVDQHETQSGRVVIRLTRDTEFGRRIIFSPIGLFPPRPHPIIAELRAAVMAAKRA